MYLKKFTFEEESGLFLPGAKPDFSYSDGIETEDYLMNAVTTAKDKSAMSQELKGLINDWPTRYHLSPSRSNLLRPLSFLDKGMDVLELGAGCGALTRYLGERCGSVDAVEGSYIRAKIARERCSDLENVKVYVDNFFNLLFDKKYDVVTLIGVLEYAPLFCPTDFENSEDACLELFKLATRAVKDDGVIILAIENKLGLKYWAGCKEDHTGKVSEGLNGYPHTSYQHAGPLTFSKKELENMFHQCGLPEIDFYYPFPDYKLPNTIIKENADYSPADLFLYNWVTTPFEDYTGVREYKFHESLALRNITKAGLFGEFANSFLIVAGKSKKHDIERRWVAKRFSTERRPRYATVTTLYIEPELTIVKELLIGVMPENYKGPIFLKQLESKWQRGDLLSFDFYEAILSDADPEGQIYKLIQSYHDKLLNIFGAGKQDEEGYPLLRGDSLDYTPWNILVHGGQWFYIDDEWEYQGLLPIDYVMFRFIINFACTQCEYLSQKNILGTDVANFILRTIQQIYSQYDSHRNEINKHRQDQLDEIVFTSSTDNKIQKLILEKQFLEKRLSDLDILLIYKKEEVEKLLLQEEQAAAERDGQIDDFKQTIAERDGQIDDFKQTIAERDGQIDALTASNEQTLNRLSQEMASLTIAQESLLYDIARSFRMLTAPVRLTKQFVRDVFNPLTAYRTMRDIHAIKRSGLFDTRYYLANNADVRLSFCDPIRHYIDHGWKEGRNPSSLFNTSYYLNQNPDVRATGINPLVHYVKSGRKEGRRPCNNALQENNVLQESDLNGSFALIHRVAGKIKKKNENTLATNSPVNDGYFKFLFEQTKKLSDIESFVPYKKHRSVETDLKLIAFYLPQFHPVQENDANWEKGFTEWTNVTKAVPQFLGHYQPQLPIDLGFYDLRLVENLKRQIDLAKNYGLHGFCFHHYWFDGKGLMRTPVDNFLAHKELDFRFCLNWANENWTKRWDGQDQEILLRQRHTPEDDIAFIKDTEKYLRDPRYIRIDGKPLLIVYRPTLLPDPKATAERWRRHCRDVGIGELFLATTHSHNQNDPRQIGFDAEIEFAPNCFHLESIAKSLQLMNKAFVGDVASYDSVVAYAKAFSAPEYRRYRGVCPSWDNEPRRPGRGYIIYGSDPAKYREWLKYICEYTQENYPKNERFIFINAWNEWAEGAHMEPDRKFGYGYLEATASVLEEYDRSRQRNIVVVSHDAYEFGAQLLAFNIVKTLAKHFNIRVVTILMGGGELQPSFEAYSEVIEWYRLTAKQKKECVSSLWARGFSKAICNTSVVGEVVGYLKDQEFTVTALIHELKNIMLAKNLLPSAQIIAQRADTIVCAAPVVADNFASVTNMDKKDILIRPQGIYYKNEFCKESARHEIVTRYDLPKDALIVLNIGYGDHRKGLDLFLAIGKEVLKHNENSYFIWVGKIAPEMQEMFRAQLDEGNNHFIFPGFIKDIGAFYCAADVFLLTSREDPFPFVVLDALQSGLPVIGFNGAGGFCDLIESGGGILVTYEDINAASRAVIELSSDLEKRILLSQQAKQIVAERFDFVDYVYDLLGYVGLKAFKVSVIIPSYNYERYLEERINSIANQTLRPYEIIFLDDGSSDNSVATARDALLRTGIKHSIIQNSENQGCFNQWVRGISLSRGELVWIAEADDCCQNNFLEELVHAFEDDDVAISYCNSYIIDEDSNVLPGDYSEWLSDISTTKWKGSYCSDGHSEVLDALSIKNTIPNASAVVMRKSALRGIEQYLPQLSTSGDWFTYIYALQRGSICYSNNKLNYHRRHKKSIIATNVASYVHFDDHLVILEYILKNFDLSPEALARSIDFLNLSYKNILAPLTGFSDIFADPRYKKKLAELALNGYGAGPVPITTGG